MPKRVVIVGAGGFGRGVYSWLSQSPRHRQAKSIQEVVFVDDKLPDAHPKAPVVGTVRDYKPDENDEVIVAVGVPEVRREIVERLDAMGAIFHSFIDDRAIIAEGVQIGQGAVICPGTVISANAAIGSHVHINFNCSVGHDTLLGNFTTLSPMTNVMGEVLVGSEVFFGGSSSVLPRIAIGDGVVVGAGSTVVHGLENHATVKGTPARTSLTTPGSEGTDWSDDIPD